jgi:hypothetical protein
METKDGTLTPTHRPPARIPLDNHDRTSLQHNHPQRRTRATKASTPCPGPCYRNHNARPACNTDDDSAPTRHIGNANSTPHEPAMQSTNPRRRTEERHLEMTTHACCDATKPPRRRATTMNPAHQLRSPSCLPSNSGVVLCESHIQSHFSTCFHSRTN